MTRLNSVIRPLPQGIIVCGLMFVVSSAAATVITLNTDPGSNGAETARFRRGEMSSPFSGTIVRVERRDSWSSPGFPRFSGS